MSFGTASYFMLRNAVASVSLSHDPNCVCQVCRAAHGDEEAMERVIVSLEKEGR